MERGDWTSGPGRRYCQTDPKVTIIIYILQDHECLSTEDQDDNCCIAGLLNASALKTKAV